jgi:predicted phosphodiesterase
MPPTPERLAGTRFGLVADAHVHPGSSPPLPAQLPALFAGVDGIFALGDLGEAAGLDALARIAPVTGVLGADDAAGDPRLPGEIRLFELGELSVGAVFDGAKHGLFAANDPLAVSPDFDAALQRVFGRRLDVLLCAATHKACIASASGVLIINPGSPTLSDQPAVAILHISSRLARAEPLRL